MKQKVIMITAGVLMFLLSIGIIVYPLVSNWYNQRHQSEIHTEYETIIQQVDNSELVRAKELADEYNAAIVPGTQLTESFSQEAILWASEDYEDQLNITGDGRMGYVEIPLIRVNLPIYHGTDSETLDAGAGHVLGTSLPVGGNSTHSVISAHSGVATKKLFSDLDKLKVGDVFYLKVLGETLAYQVDQINTVLPHDTTHLGITEGADLCTLITCVPFGVNTHRLLVRGSRIPYEEAEVIVEEQILTEELPASTWEQQYIKGLVTGIVILFLISIIVAICLYLKPKRKRGKYEAR